MLWEHLHRHAQICIRFQGCRTFARHIFGASHTGTIEQAGQVLLLVKNYGTWAHLVMHQNILNGWFEGRHATQSI